MPRPKTGSDLRALMMRFIQESSECSKRFCDCTFTAWYPYTGLSMSGE